MLSDKVNDKRALLVTALLAERLEASKLLTIHENGNLVGPLSQETPPSQSGEPDALIQ